MRTMNKLVGKLRFRRVLSDFTEKTTDNGEEVTVISNDPSEKPYTKDLKDSSKYIKNTGEVAIEGKYGEYQNSGHVIDFDLDMT